MTGPIIPPGELDNPQDTGYQARQAARSCNLTIGRRGLSGLVGDKSPWGVGTGRGRAGRGRRDGVETMP